MITERLMSGVFTIATIALLVKYAGPVANFIRNSTNVYSETVKGLQGR